MYMNQLTRQMYKLAVQKKIWLLVKFPQMHPSYIAFNLVSV